MPLIFKKETISRIHIHEEKEEEKEKRKYFY
jgi:hypothetical protein